MSASQDFLPYKIGYLTPELERIAKNELHETDETKVRCLQELRALIKGEKRIYYATDDELLLAYLRAKKFNVEKAFEYIKAFCRFRADYGHIYDNISNEEVHEVFGENWIGFLPHRDKEGHVIIVWKVGMWDPDKVPRNLVIAMITHLLVHSIEDPGTQVRGYNVILDFNGCGRKIIMQCTPENVMILVRGTQHSFPARFAGVHVIGAPAISSIIYAIAYPFLPRKIRSRIFLHGNDTKSLHSKIPPCILPAEYGGDLGPFDNKFWMDCVLNNEDFWNKFMSCGYKEEKRSS